jgi:hypothetical protein
MDFFSRGWWGGRGEGRGWEEEGGEGHSDVDLSRVQSAASQTSSVHYWGVGGGAM